MTSLEYAQGILDEWRPGWKAIFIRKIDPRCMESCVIICKNEKGEPREQKIHGYLSVELMKLVKQEEEG